ncbi:hypothetical protein GGF31_005044 [Allomyces arbusculus]|nr:hypothetical protein GGF31_005044 [Allomyces arbusculus]
MAPPVPLPAHPADALSMPCSVAPLATPSSRLCDVLPPTAATTAASRPSGKSTVKMPLRVRQRTLSTDRVLVLASPRLPAVATILAQWSTANWRICASAAVAHALYDALASDPRKRAQCVPNVILAHDGLRADVLWYYRQLGARIDTRTLDWAHVVASVAQTAAAVPGYGAPAALDVVVLAGDRGEVVQVFGDHEIGLALAAEDAAVHTRAESERSMPSRADTAAMHFVEVV